ncbi:MAG: UDP-N-acetylglucosamine 2-epimerase (hydrolyzing) [Vicinamibacteria bacterium]|nr:UDP-N-acetylglucosamine 2-epimerase (hydrolyzing) [Vicinamibacteria bacterium]
MSRRIGVLTTGRQDWGILRSTCLALREDSAFDLKLLVGGMHLSDAFGRTEFEIADDGFKADAALPWISADASSDALEQSARALEAVGHALERLDPEALLLVGDRFETAAAAIAATLSRVPVVHLHGGEETAGAVDNTLRHAITQMAQLHLVSHEAHRDRVVSMGIDPKTVHVVGAPGLDNLRRADLLTAGELAQKLGMELNHPLVVVTLHPSTASSVPGEAEVAALCEAMDEVAATFVITLPNSDPGHLLIREALVRAAQKPGRVAVEALGSRGYWGLLSQADAMLGNSSSAIIEGSALGLPAVNIGDRQQGRLRGNNVIDAPVDAVAIKSALRHALDPATRRACQESGPFGHGRSADAILDILRLWNPPFGRIVAVDRGGR